ncbi:MAG: DUF3782 domain-containing protein [Magnetococcales bacterium]|nr:DUF3782 domain-containing protein [Magnetococcales bacterium]MBF0156888.1 DUF3782 domain-containing protein [Magnetococcales bacterium]
MSQAVTFDSVWKMFQEMVRETRERSADLDHKFQETDREIKELSREVREVSREVREVSREVREVSRQMGDLGGKWGLFVENMVAPNCVKLFAERGISVNEVYKRVMRRRADGRTMEIDILVIDSDVAVLVEVKSTLTRHDVRGHLQRIGEFREFFPRYGEYRLMGAVSGIVIEKGVEEYARRQGLFVLVQAGETMRLDNPPDFLPRVW